MLLAKKENVERVYRKRMLEIREKELEYYIMNLQNVAQLSAFLVGLTWSSLVETSGGRGVFDLTAGDDTTNMFELCYPIAVVISTCFCTLSLWGCTLIAVLAPRLALHGSPANFHVSVDALEEEYYGSMSHFGGSLVSFIVASVLWAGAQAYVVQGVIISILFLLTLAVMHCLLHYLGSTSFYLPSNRLISGRWFINRSLKRVKYWAERVPNVKALLSNPALRRGYRRLQDTGEPSGRLHRNSAESIVRYWQLGTSSRAPSGKANTRMAHVAKRALMGSRHTLKGDVFASKQPFTQPFSCSVLVHMHHLQRGLPQAALVWLASRYIGVYRSGQKLGQLARQAFTLRPEHWTTRVAVKNTVSTMNALQAFIQYEEAVRWAATRLVSMALRHQRNIGLSSFEQRTGRNVDYLVNNVRRLMLVVRCEEVTRMALVSTMPCNAERQAEAGNGLVSRANACEKLRIQLATYITFIEKLLHKHIQQIHTLPPAVAALTSAYLSTVSRHVELAKLLHKHEQAMHSSLQSNVPASYGV